MSTFTEILITILSIHYAIAIINAIFSSSKTEIESFGSIDGKIILLLYTYLLWYKNIKLDIGILNLLLNDPLLRAKKILNFIIQNITGYSLDNPKTFLLLFIVAFLYNFTKFWLMYAFTDPKIVELIAISVVLIYFMNNQIPGTEGFKASFSVFFIFLSSVILPYTLLFSAVNNFPDITLTFNQIYSSVQNKTVIADLNKYAFSAAKIIFFFMLKMLIIAILIYLIIILYRKYYGLLASTISKFNSFIRRTSSTIYSKGSQISSNVRSKIRQVSSQTRAQISSWWSSLNQNQKIIVMSLFVILLFNILLTIVLVVSTIFPIKLFSFIPKTPTSSETLPTMPTSDTTLVSYASIDELNKAKKGSLLPSIDEIKNSIKLFFETTLISLNNIINALNIKNIANLGRTYMQISANYLNIYLQEHPILTSLLIYAGNIIGVLLALFVLAFIGDIFMCLAMIYIEQVVSIYSGDIFSKSKTFQNRKTGYSASGSSSSGSGSGSGGQGP